MMECLPVIPHNYQNYHPLVSKEGHTTETPEIYSHNLEQFQSLFDGAAFGQYLGGQDPRNGSSDPGYIAPDCVFNASNFDGEWRDDEQGRRIPYAEFHGECYRINNLHIHSKNLKPFLSRDRT